ncbi:transporter substrate-binding domain-containing protein [Arsukibacterium sp.]|uniref:substrate-binding periplasmic protein n=1 Tax=Arsukibacterium sp. TaxID=1977258 RepID=UPI001BD67246|nr:transporter substrate-binding domain-containing protein [Arsukibacterium sp.]
MLSHLHAQVLRVAIPDEDYPPYYYVLDDNLTGFSVETLQSIASELELTLEFQRLPWSRVVNHVETGKADVIPVFYKTPARMQRFEFSDESYLIDPIVLLCANPCPLQFDGTLASLGSEPVATVRHFSYGSVLDEMRFPRVDLVESDHMLFRMLLGKRVKLVMASAHTITHSSLLQQSAAEVLMLQPALDFVEVYFAFGKQQGLPAAQRRQFNQALAKFKRGERYQQLLAKYQLQSR